MNLVLNLIVVAASVLGSGMALPQAVKLARTRNVEGVSSAWIGVSMAINVWWTIYAVHESVWALLPVSTVSLVLYASMGLIYLRSVGRAALPGFALGALVLGEWIDFNQAVAIVLTFTGIALASLGYGAQVSKARASETT